MKKLLFLILFFASTAYAVTPVSVTDGGGNADTLEGQNGSFYLNVENSTGESSFGALSDDNDGLGVTYNLTTSFQTYTSFDTANNSSDMILSTGDGTVTIGAGSGGEYSIQADISVTAVGGVELEFGLFRNDTTELGTFNRGVSGIHFHAPVLINLSSDTGGAAYNTHSSIENLEFSDSDDVWIDEASSGNSPLIFDMTFDDEVLYPTAVEFHGVLYDGAAAHEVEALMWNYSTSVWVNMRSSTFDFPDSGGTDPFRYYDREFEVPFPRSSYVNMATNESKARMDHTSTGSPGHQIRIDKVHLHDEHGSAAVSTTRVITLTDGDVLSIKIKSDKFLPVYFANLHFHVTKVSN